MNATKIFWFCAFLFGMMPLRAQEPGVGQPTAPVKKETFLLNVVDRDQYESAVVQRNNNDQPMPYPYVEESDVLWSKSVWEVIDLDERINAALYYPTDTLNIETYRRSLFDVLIANIKNGRIKSVYADTYFKEKRTYAELQASLQRVDTTDAGIAQFNAGDHVSEEYIDRRAIGAADIEQYLIYGTWYFDKRMGELKYRLLAMAPVAPDVNFIDDESVDPDENLVPLFWVWYPSIRKVMEEAKVYNPGNEFRPISFDALLNARRFNSIIVKEGNVFDNRAIKDYIKDNALFQLLESNRIKEAIRDKEQDMWNY
jgi:gliding motility associated protien GldN